MNIANQVRSYFYLSGVLVSQERDSSCRSCSSYQGAVVQVAESIAGFERARAEEIEGLPHDLSLLFLIARSGISGIRTHPRPASQKKTGTCILPAGVCFLRHSQVILDKIGQPGRLSLVQPFDPVQQH